MAESAPEAPDRLSRLRDLANLLEDSIRESTVGVRAQLAAQYRATLAEIDELVKARPEQKGTALDELNARRAAREKGA